jgi:hypothetical protein
MVLFVFLFLFFGVSVVYWRARMQGSLNNTFWDLTYVLFPVPILYLWGLILLEIISDSLYFSFIQCISEALSFMQYVVPGLGKTESGLIQRGMEVRALEVVHNYSIILLFSIFSVVLFVVHGLGLSNKEMDWLDTQPAAAFEPRLRYMMYVGCGLMLALVASLSSYDSSIVCRVGKCWSTVRANFPVFYLIPQGFIIFGLVLGITLRRPIAWRYKQRELNDV